MSDLNSASVLCPNLTMFKEPPLFITADTQFSIFLDNYNRTPGTVVHMHCASSLSLVGPATTMCQSDGSWDLDEKPVCRTTGSFDTVSGLSDNQKLIIGITGGVGGFVIIALSVIVILLILQSRNERYREMKYTSPSEIFANSSSSDGTDRDYRISPSRRSSRESSSAFPVVLPYGYSRNTSSPDRVSSRNSRTSAPVRDNSMELHLSPMTLLPRPPLFRRGSGCSSIDSNQTRASCKWDERSGSQDLNWEAFRRGRDPFLWRPLSGISFQGNPV